MADSIHSVKKTLRLMPKEAEELSGKAKQAKIVTVDTMGRFSNAVVTETLGFRPAIYIIYK